MGWGKNVAIFSFILVILFSFSAVFADPIGAIIDEGTESFYTPDTTPSNSTVTASGTITANFTSIGSTNKWAGFYGQIKGFFFLADAANNQFLNWSISDPSGSFLYASETNSLTWPSNGNWTPATDSDAPAYIQAYATDNYNATFRYSNAVFIQTPEYIIVENTNYSKTFSNGAESDILLTYSVVDDSSNIVFASPVSSDVTGYDGSSIDYQMVVPVNGASSSTYYFWIELA